MTEELETNEVVQPVVANVSAGKMLAEARTRLGLSVAEIARQLRLSTSQIEALESDNYAKLPGKTFLRGFIRNYAKVLQIDPEPLLNLYHPEAPSVQSIAVPTVSIEFGSKRRLMPFGDRSERFWLKYVFAGGGALVVLALFWGGFRFFQGVSSSTEVAEKPAGESTMVLMLPQSELPAPIVPVEPEPVPSPVIDPVTAPVTPAVESIPVPAVAVPVVPPAAVPSTDMNGARLQFAFDADSWVEVKDKNGKIMSHQLNPRGIPLLVRGTPPFYLIVGNATHVKVMYNDKPVDLQPYIKLDVARLTIE